MSREPPHLAQGPVPQMMSDRPTTEEFKVKKKRAVRTKPLLRASLAKPLSFQLPGFCSSLSATFTTGVRHAYNDQRILSWELYTFFTTSHLISNTPQRNDVKIDIEYYGFCVS
jgi:hypothetical protein